MFSSTLARWALGCVLVGVAAAPPPVLGQVSDPFASSEKALEAAKSAFTVGAEALDGWLLSQQPWQRWAGLLREDVMPAFWLALHRHQVGQARMNAIEDGDPDRRARIERAHAAGVAALSAWLETLPRVAEALEMQNLQAYQAQTEAVHEAKELTRVYVQFLEGGVRRASSGPPGGGLSLRQEDLLGTWAWGEAISYRENTIDHGDHLTFRRGADVTAIRYDFHAGGLYTLGYGTSVRSAGLSGTYQMIETGAWSLEANQLILAPIEYRGQSEVNGDQRVYHETRLPERTYDVVWEEGLRLDGFCPDFFAEPWCTDHAGHPRRESITLRRE